MTALVDSSWQKATQISSSPLVEEDSGSEDDTSSLGSLRSSVLGPDRKGSTPSSPRALKRGKGTQHLKQEPTNRGGVAQLVWHREC